MLGEEAAMRGLSRGPALSFELDLRSSANTDQGTGSGLGFARPAASAADLPALLLVEAAPNAGILAGVERPLEKDRADRAGHADGDRSGRLFGCRTRRSHREEEFGIFCGAAAELYPV